MTATGLTGMKRVLRVVAGGVLCAGMAATLHAQFSGPALSVPVQPNTVQVPTTDPAVLNPALQDVHIAPGDLVAVRIFGVPDFAPPVRVNVDGSIQLPLIGLVQVEGLTINRAEDLIAQRLITAGMYLNPQVTIAVTEASGQFATVGGEMHAVIPITGNRRLLEVLAAAGPMPLNASHTITILRPGVDKPLVVDLGTDPSRVGEANIPILPRDTILISRVGVVYVVGAFLRQGAIPLDQNSPLTLMQATALSGGPGFEGQYNDLRIIRTVGLERRVVKTDIKAVLNGKRPDPVLEANDIIFLPSNTIKAVIKTGGISTLTSVASLLIFALRP